MLLSRCDLHVPQSLHPYNGNSNGNCPSVLRGWRLPGSIWSLTPQHGSPLALPVSPLLQFTPSWLRAAQPAGNELPASLCAFLQPRPAALAEHCLSLVYKVTALSLFISLSHPSNFHFFCEMVKVLDIISC